MKEVKEIFRGLFNDIVAVPTSYTDGFQLRWQDVAPKELAVITHVSVINESTNYTRLRIGVETQKVFSPFIEEPLPLADRLYWTFEQFYLRTGNILMAEMKGTTASDVVKMRIQGYRYAFVRV